MSNSVRPHGPWPARLLCPWESPGKNTEVGCHFLLQGIFLTQGSNLSFLHCKQIVFAEPYQLLGSVLTLVIGLSSMIIFCFRKYCASDFRLLIDVKGFPGAQLLKNPPVMWETWV